MDSKVVNKQMRIEIRPLLREAGFSKFTGRSAWRYSGPRIDVVNFQSFNAYNAGVLGCTTYSFAVNLSCYLTYLPSEHGEDQIKVKDGQLRPEEYECPFRHRLRRRFPQPEMDPRYTDIWYIDPEGRYLDKALHDVRMILASEGFAWFDEFADRAAVFEMLKTMVSEHPSPINHYLTGYAAMAVNEAGPARAHLQAVVDSGCFEHIRTRIDADLRSLQ